MTEGERSFLGLTRNPFVEPFLGFFDRGGRKTYLEQLRHLSQWSRRVLLVTGPSQVGKTTLYRELGATLEPRIKAARINAGLVNSGREVLAAIAHGFGVVASSTSNIQQLRRDLIAHVESQTAADRPCLVLVDDAHLLDNRAVEELVALVHESPLHLVLFGEVRLVPVIERAASGKGVGWQEIRLSGYGDADARDYLEWRFQQAKYRGRNPFTDQQVRELVKLAQGLPGRINQMANVLLVRLEAGELAVDGGRFPRVHLAVLGLLVILVGLLYVLFSERPAREATVALTLPPPGGVMGAAEEGPDTQPADPAGAAVDDPMSTAGGEQELVGLRAEAAGEEAGTTADTVPEAPGTASAARDDSAAPAADPAPVQERQMPPAPAVSPSAADTDLASTVSSVRDTRWLLRQNPAFYTLQLVTVSARERAQAFVAKQKEPGEFAIYQLQRDGRILHVVLYGLFSTREAAQAAADRLPAEVGDVQPWIRQVGQVQAAARISTLQ